MKEVGLYIPCFNSAKTIGFCLEAVFKQTHPLKKVLVIDDGSTDETALIASRYPLRVIRHEDNHGLAAARNTAIRNLNTKFIASLDADCVPAHNWLECLMQRFISSKIAGAGGKLIEFQVSSIFDLWRSVHMKQYWDDSKKTPPFLFGSNNIFAREKIINIGLYNENLENNYEDVEMCSRIRKAGYRLIYEHKAIAYHLRRDDICSILDTYWKWNIAYYKHEGHYIDINRFVYKIKDNLGLANRYLEEDIRCQRYQLIYLDFLLAIHHSLMDFEYFISQNNTGKRNHNYSPMPFWLTLMDFDFFYHLNTPRSGISTLIPVSNSFLQNFYAFNLILNGIIRKKFKGNYFQRVLYRHLFLSVYKIDNAYLLIAY